MVYWLVFKGLCKAATSGRGRTILSDPATTGRGFAETDAILHRLGDEVHRRADGLHLQRGVFVHFDVEVVLEGGH
jgi:hypothetical protein